MNDVIGGNGARSHANDVDVPVRRAGEPMFLVNDLLENLYRGRLNRGSLGARCRGLLAVPHRESVHIS